MEEIVRLARQLGKQIAQHPRGRSFHEAQEAVHADENARALLQEYDVQARRMYELESRNQPIEVEDKRKLMDIQQRMAGNPALSQLMRAQADYVEMMQSVSGAIENPEEEGNRE